MGVCDSNYEFNKKTPEKKEDIKEINKSDENKFNKEENDNNNINEDSLDQNQININNNENIDKDEEEEFKEDNQGNQIMKEFDVEITKVSDKNNLMNKNLYLSVSAIEDDYEQEKINKEKLNDILQNLPSTRNFTVYSYKNNNRIKVIFYLKDEEDKIIGKLPIILSNKESHERRSGKG